MKKERVINFKEYLMYLVNHWVIVAVLIVVFAAGFLLVCFLNNTDSQSMNSQAASANKNAAELYSKLDYFDRVAVDVAVNDFEDYYQSFELLENSIIEKIDSYRARKLSLTYSISYAGDEEVSGEELVSLINRYSIMLYYYGANGSLSTDVSEITNIDTALIQDCISMSSYTTDSGIINLDVYGTEVEESLEEAVVSSMNAYIASLTQDSELEIDLINSNASFVKVSWMFASQRDWEAEQNKIKSRLDTAVAGLSSDAYDYFKLIASAEHPEFFESLYPENTIIKPNSSISPKTLLKYAVVGSVLGFVLYAVYVMILFMYSKKIITITDYSDTMGLKVLGCVTNSNKDTDMDIITTKILASCNKQSIDEIALVSTNAEGTKEYIDLLSEKLEKNGLKVKSIISFMGDHKEMGELLKIANSVIVEKMNSSLYSEVYDEVDFCNENAVNILGLVNIAK